MRFRSSGPGTLHNSLGGHDTFANTFVVGKDWSGEGCTLSEDEDALEGIEFSESLTLNFKRQS